VEIVDRPVSPIAPGEVRVRVNTAAVNYPDVLLIANRYQISVPPPFVPGSEFAGTVTEIGTAVENNPGQAGFAIGDQVTGTGLYGAFAEEVVVPAAGLAHVPAGIDPRTAAASGVAFRTAYHALRSVARIGEGDDVVVLGAGGGVGLAAVQLATRLGARVTAVASSVEKLAAAESFGATNLIDHRGGDLRGALRTSLPDGADAVLDPVGGDLSEPALRALHRGGRFVTIGYAAGVIPRIPLNLVLVKGIQIVGFQFQDIPQTEFHRNEDELRDHLVTGRIRPHIGAEFALAETAAALRLVADGQAIGKVLINLDVD
jgi:NADPH2:quinone reductase